MRTTMIQGQKPYCGSHPSPWYTSYLRSKTLHSGVFHSLLIVRSIIGFVVETLCRAFVLRIRLKLVVWLCFDYRLIYFLGTWTRWYRGHLPLIGKLLTKGAPICIARKPGDVKHIGHSVKDLDAAQEWQWTQVRICDRSTSHNVYRYSERLALIGTPNKLTVKVPKYINID